MSSADAKSALGDAAKTRPDNDATKAMEKELGIFWREDPDRGGRPSPPRGSPAPDPVQFETRRQDLAGRARAAGVTLTGSDADLLGYSAMRKRAGAARRILGD